MNTVGNVGKYVWGALLHFAHRMFTPLMVVVIIYAVLVAGFSALTPWVRMYKPQINQYLNQSLHHQIEVEDIKTSWYGLYPVVKLIHVKISEPEEQPWVCDECWVGFDILRSLFYWHVHPGLLYVDGLNLNIVQSQGHWQLTQAKFLESNPSDTQDFATRFMQILLGMMAYMPEKILLKNIDISIQPEHAAVVTLQDVRLLGQKKEGQYYWAAEANLDKKSLLKLRIDMPLLSNMAMPDSGRVYFEALNLQLQKMPWYKDICQALGIEQLKGESSLQAWFDWKDKAISSIHASFNGKNFFVNSKKLSEAFDIPSYDANLLWQKNANGWELAINKLNLDISGVSIKDDKFLLFYQGDWDNYHFYVKAFPLQLLKKVKNVLPQDFIKPWILNSKGMLKELQMNFKDGQLDYFLSEFDKVNWPLSTPIPGVNGLSGVLSWENSGMHLELSSPGIELQFPHTLPLKFDHFNAVLSTRPGLNQTVLELENFVLTRPDVVVSLNGEIDEPLDALKRNFRLQGAWSLNHVEQWRAYLSNWLPASGLRNWLQNDVKRIEKASGEMILNGLWKDFPFEQGNGEFTVNSYLYGVDLNFANLWPTAKNIDAQLVVQQRQLEAKIDKGLLSANIPIKEVSLLIPNMGTGRDEMLIHGHLQAPIQEMLSYLLNTSLKTKAKAWQVYQFKGDATLDLKLDIPLNTPGENILTKGHLQFPEQHLDLNIFSKPLKATHVKGYLDFDTQGLTQGSILGHLGTDPFKLEVKNQENQAKTVINFSGGLEIDVLKRALNLENTDFISGHMPLQGQIFLTGSKSKQFQMVWKSSLKGVKLDIPQPWAKSAPEEKPLRLTMTTQPGNQDLKMQFDYMNSQWLVEFLDKVWHVATEQENFAGHLYYHPQNALLDLRLSKLWLNSQFMKSDNPEQHQPWRVKDMPNLHVSVSDFRWENLNLGQLEVEGQNEGNRWVLKQCGVEAPYYAVMITGDVRVTGKGRYATQFNGEMRINSLQNALEMWEITPVANARDGLINFKGGWPLAFNQCSLKTLDGDLDIILKKGNITHLDPETEQKIGLGKLLSILSLQTLPRRLQLDFSDLATKGFTFDVFKGHFDLQDGLLQTTDSVMDGPIANIKIYGNLNVLDRWYDLELQVFPYITASLPVVATIAGGPLAGVATWAANHVINQGMQRVSGYTYKITGPWQQPVVQQVGLERSR